MTLCVLHSMYNDKVSEIGRCRSSLIDCLIAVHTAWAYRSPLGFKQDDLCRAELLDDFLDNSLLKLLLLDMAQRGLEVNMKVT